MVGEFAICRSMSGDGDVPWHKRGPVYVEADLPQLFADKSRLTRHLIAEGLGGVYLTLDLRLVQGVVALGKAR